MVRRSVQWDCGFQSTPPQGGRLLHFSAASGVTSFQSTPPQGGRRRSSPPSNALKAFQSTPPQGGRLWDRLVLLLADKFQSTPPQGGRPEGGRAAGPLHVSIHAPAGGATATSSTSGPSTSSFNPRPRRGGDARLDRPGAQVVLFQSTPPQGGRPNSRKERDDAAKFQSTPPQGGRLLGDLEIGLPEVSIHAPAGGATPDHHGVRGRLQRFNPRPRRAGDPLPSKVISAGRKFQSTPPQGGRLRPVRRSAFLEVSIHAPAGGATIHDFEQFQTSSFQSTPPQGGRRRFA